MGKSTSSYINFVKEQLAPIPNLKSSRLFGGIGFSDGAVQFAMIIENTLYFVVNDRTRTKYENMGSHCFAYNTKKGKVEVKRYYSVPADILEDQDELSALATESIKIAHDKKPASPKPAMKKVKVKP